MIVLSESVHAKVEKQRRERTFLPTAAGVVFHRIQRKIILVEPRRYPGERSLPKGGHKRKRDGDILGTLFNEIWEETGLVRNELQVHEHLGNREVPFRANSVKSRKYSHGKDIHGFLVTTTVDKLVPVNRDEIASCDWCTSEEAFETILCMPPETQTAMRGFVEAGFALFEKYYAAALAA